MTSNPGMNMNSVLPLNARTMRIAAGGGLSASLTVSSMTGKETSGGDGVDGLAPDGLDFPMPHAAEFRTASSPSVPGPSVQADSFPNGNPT